ncbi:MAG TPA: Holliday junction branch migration protein RuvA [Gammaproteobacteria bacterium]|nr:Holliday junction branch migration protein RuvA [Gammaproteobacteria bacterium]
MIGQVSGTLVYKHPPQLMVDVGGVAYELEAPMTAFYELPEAGERVSLFTHLVIRDDAHLLFGFADLQQRDVFRVLLKISGVGPRVALALLSGLTTDDLAACVAAGDIVQLTRVPGIGRKTAERLVIELRDRLETAAGAGPDASGVTLTPQQDAVSALIALGYREAEASRAVRAVEVDGMPAVETLIREALKGLSREAP